MNKTLALLLAVFAFASTIEARVFTFKNNCAYTVWPGALNGAGHPLPLNGGWVLLAGQSNTVGTPDDWNGRFWGRTKCSFDTAGRGSCETGDCGGVLACNGAGGNPPATLAEFTLDGAGGLDFFDLSLVDGYNLPMAITPSTCSGPSCVSDLNQSCPSELQEVVSGQVVACLSACEKFNTDEYCCRGAYGTPQTCHPTNYSEIFKAACPTAYSYAYDDASSTFTCSNNPNYLITFCP